MFMTNYYLGFEELYPLVHEGDLSSCKHAGWLLFTAVNTPHGLGLGKKQ